MTDPITYAQVWNNRLREPKVMLTHDQARQRYADGTRLTALIGDPARPWVTLEIHSSVPRIDVQWLDPRGLKSEVRVFGHRDGHVDLFLSQIHRYVVTDEGKTTEINSVYCWPEGRTYAERNFLGKAPKETAKGNYDPADRPWLWEPMPTFGQYHSILRTDRTSPA